MTTDRVFEKTSWTAYRASIKEPYEAIITPTALLTLFHESAHTVAMIRHSKDVVRNATESLNPGKAPVLGFDQPLHALAKRIRWKWPETHGENKLVVVFGGLHVEMVALKTSDWLKGRGWTQTLAQTEIAAAPIGVGAGKFLGMRRILPEFPQTCPKKNPKKMTYKKTTAFHWPQDTSSTIFAHILPNFAHISPDLPETN